MTDKELTIKEHYRKFIKLLEKNIYSKYGSDDLLISFLEEHRNKYKYIEYIGKRNVMIAIYKKALNEICNFVKTQYRHKPSFIEIAENISNFLQKQLAKNSHFSIVTV